MSADKYPNIFSRQMKTIVYLYYDSVNGGPLSFQAIREKKASKRSFFSFGKLLKLVLLLLVAAVAIDIYKHRGYKGTMLLVSFCFVPFS